MKSLHFQAPPDDHLFLSLWVGSEQPWAILMQDRHLGLLTPFSVRPQHRPSLSTSPFSGADNWGQTTWQSYPCKAPDSLGALDATVHSQLPTIQIPHSSWIIGLRVFCVGNSCFLRRWLVLVFFATVPVGGVFCNGGGCFLRRSWWEGMFFATAGHVFCIGRVCFLRRWCFLRR